jgi:GPH family glycoside/pentoside/hexuronide:cation symporter
MAAPSRNHRLTWRLRIGWGVGSLGGAALINAVTFLALFYLTQILGLSPAVAGALMFITKCYDIVTDPVMGIVSDRTETRWGRRRPFLLAASLLSAGSVVMLFNTPDWPAAATTVYAAAALLLYATGYTIFNIPYLAMPAEMTDDYHERSRLMSARVVFASLGILAGGALAPALVTWFGDGRPGYASMSWVLAAIIGISMAACFFGTRSAMHTRHVSSTLSLREQWALAIGNRPFVVLILSKLLHISGVAVSISSLLFLVTLVLQREPLAAGAFGLVSTAGTLVSIPAWLALCDRWGKRNTYIVGVVIYVPILLSWLFTGPNEAFFLFLLRGFGIGVVTGGLTLTAQAMLPDTIQYDAERSGLRREGTFTSIYSFMEKTAFAIGPLLVGLMLENAGFSGDSPGSATAETVRAILIATAIIPAIASGASAALLRYYNLDLILRKGRDTPVTDGDDQGA